MPHKKKRKLTRNKIIAIVAAGVAILAAVAIIIVNVFVPVKYLSSYFVLKDSTAAGQMRVSFVDVGNSDCTIIELPDGKTVLIDGGDGTYPHNLKIFKELNRRNIDKIDYLICSSVEEGACGGLSEILKYKSVGKIFAPYYPITYINSGYNSFCAELKNFGGEVSYCEYGAGIKGDGYSLCFLSPDSHAYEGGEYSQLLKDPSLKNVKNASAVIWLEYSGISFLFLGSTGQAVQTKLINFYNASGFEFGGRKIDLTKCTIVKMSDHGSTDGSYAPFLDLIKPKVAIISVGANGMGLPTLAALSNAQNFVGDNILRTDELGTVTMTVKDGRYETSKEKK